MASADPDSSGSSGEQDPLEKVTEFGAWVRGANSFDLVWDPSIQRHGQSGEGEGLASPPDDPVTLKGVQIKPDRHTLHRR